MQISVEHLTMKYEHVLALDDVSFQVDDGDYLCIVGANGSGKSTLLKAILGLVHPDGGNICFGNGITRADLGYLPQQMVVERDFPASVWEVVLSGTLRQKGRRPFFRRAEKETALANLKKLEIEDLRQKSFQELSGGQRQRVLLARALSSAGKVLLLDEPVTGLDPEITKSLYELVAKLNREDGLTVMMVSHDLQGALEYGSKILHLEQKVAFFGEKNAYLRQYGAKFSAGGGGA